MKFIDFLRIKEDNVQADIQPVDNILMPVKKETKDQNYFRFLRLTDDDSGEDIVNGETLEDVDTDSEDEEYIEDILFWLLSFFIHQSPEHIHKSQKFLFDEYYDSEEQEESPFDEDGYFDLGDLAYILLELLENDVDEYDILDDLDIDDSEVPLSDEEGLLIQEIIDELFEEEDFYDLDEQVKGRFLTKNYNKKRRKFMQKSKAVMNRTKVKRRQDARKTRVKRRMYYRKNKNRIKRYNKQYRRALKKNVHRKKIRRNQ